MSSAEIHTYTVEFIYCQCCDREVELNDSHEHGGERLCGECHRRATHKTAWTDGKIRGDRRIDHADPAVRRIAETLHRNESMHMHEWIDMDVCAYCALRASRAVRQLRAIESEMENTE